MQHEIRHASCVDLDGQGVLILGRAGAGKSTLALHLIGLGAGLIADDQTRLDRVGTDVWASRPDTLPPLIEARGIGLLQAPMIERAPVSLVIDLDEIEDTRLPPLRHVTLLGCRIPLLHGVEGLHFPSAIQLLLRHGRSVP